MTAAISGVISGNRLVVAPDTAVAGPPTPRKAPIWIDTMLGNVKNAIQGTYHARKHLPRYLAEFCWRFNRRFDLANLLPRVIQPKLESHHDA